MSNPIVSFVLELVNCLPVLDERRYLFSNGDFLDFFFFMYDIRHCFICRPSDSTVSEGAGIESRTVATTRHGMSDALTTRLDLIHNSAISHPLHTQLDLIHLSARSHPHSARTLSRESILSQIIMQVVLSAQYFMLSLKAHSIKRATGSGQWRAK
jgi:hypothetical protein